MKLIKLMPVVLLGALPLVAKTEKKPTKIQVSCKLYGGLPNPGEDRRRVTTAAQQERVAEVKKGLIFRGREAIRAYKRDQEREAELPESRMPPRERYADPVAFAAMIKALEAIIKKHDAGMNTEIKYLGKKAPFLEGDLIAYLEANLEEFGESMVADFEAIHGRLEVVRKELSAVGLEYWQAMLEEMRA